MATYYIGTDGSSSNDGSYDSPYGSFDDVSALLKPGDTVYYKGGIYTNSTYGNGNIWKSANDVALTVKNVNGTSDAPITIAAAPGEAVKIKFDGNGGIRLINSDYINIEGLEIEGPNQSITLEEALEHQFEYRIDTDGDGDLTDEVTLVRDPEETLEESVASLGGEMPSYYNAHGIVVGNGSNHITISNNTVHDVSGCAVSSKAGADYVTVSNNHFYNNCWYEAAGNHVVSFKGIVSSDDYDGDKIIVTGNLFEDNYNQLISWATLKTAPVTMSIDEGKAVHIQNSTTETGFDHGSILVDGNVMVRNGNAAVTANEADRVTISNNTIVDGAYLNTLLAEGSVDPKVDANFKITAGGFRLAGGDDITVINNVVILSGSVAYSIDASAAHTDDNTVAENNIQVGGNTNVVFLRANDSKDLSAGFTSVATVVLLDTDGGDYRVQLADGSYVGAFLSDVGAEGLSNGSDATLTISGELEQNATLTAELSEHEATGYQWYRNGVAIEGATDASYTLSQADVGTLISVGASYLGDTGTETAITDSSALVANVNDAPTGSYQIEGTAEVGQTLTAVLSISDADDIDTATLAFQWYRNGVAISGATEGTYTLTVDDAEQFVSVVFTYTDGYATNETLIFDPVSVEELGSLITASGDLDMRDYAAVPDALLLEGGDYKVIGNDLANQITGNSGDNLMRGNGGNDTLTGGLGNDSLYGGNGDDVILLDEGFDVLSGGNGTDTILIGDAAGTVDLAVTTEQWTRYNRDTITGFENVQGGAGDDKIYGSNANNLLIGGDGSDRVFGRGGRDVMQLDAGDDTLNGGNGTDTLTVLDDRDTTVDLGVSDAQNTGYGLDVVSGFENITGGAGDDAFTGNRKSNQLDGGAGDDALNGRDSADTLIGGAGSDTLIGGRGADRLYAGESDGAVDVFIYMAIADSKVGNGDTVYDFETGVDLIDLSQIDANGKIAGDDAFLYAENAARNSVWIETVGGVSIIYADRTRDGIADLQITVYGDGVLGSSDLVL
ncbi:hypothetical protein HJ526_19030 [Donghicola sp. C2-DW-16]|uniref:Peptidase M10 serralysin C-terminal domain-containing protein n=1 Tax=Donghicola mangrovi TaxID=2729614 RepID=A0ABX2PK86_9RHOB|nr:M10 family metallopeptidase C-terminal domain-containing protein [Donghicola mangrovi]NVO29519.1 hypothetical protein [Donghicola mangrovi]